MDDGSCAVCAEPVEWVAYGPCGHRDVCAVCIARLRFVCDDRRCCICKSLSPSVFVTRALGSLTRVINDFPILPAGAKDGKVGSYWYHKDTQSYFDDWDEYRVIKAMCKLSCCVCDKLEAEGKRNSKKRSNFKSVEQLKDHLSRQHELFLCSLCLEYKKVFISEQKLYSRVQLRQHIRCGDSEVDGSENERCGFSGHPSCDFCQRPFYGDNELYFHMSTEHYTCHICQRQQSTQYDYYKDYNDLENHFREVHFLCEDDTCLEKKFIVFSTEADMKRHSALEHGGNMSRSKRRTALQLDTCFHHWEREDEDRRVRAHVSFPGASNRQLSSASSASGERTNSTVHDASSVVQEFSGHRGTGGIDATTATTVPSSGQLQGAILDFRSVLMSGSDFPPLPGSSKRRRRKSKQKSENTGVNHSPPVSNSSQFRSSSSGLSLNSSPFASPQIGSLAIGHSTSSSSVNSFHLLTPISDGNPSASSANSWTNSIEDFVGSSSSSASSNLINKESVHPSVSESIQIGDDIQAANKSLVERIRASLEFDKDKYATFKVISQEFREGVIDTGEYIAYVHQFGLAHLIPDLAKLCPDPQKQKELMEVHETSLRDSNENRLKSESGKKSASKQSKKGKEKGKEKCGDSEGCSKGETLDTFVEKLKELKLKAEESLASRPKTSSDDAERSLLLLAESFIQVAGRSSDESSNSSSGAAVTGSKKKMKKQSKFLKTRLGESSASVTSDLNCSDLASDLMMVRPNQDSILASVRGVWRNGGGRRLVTLSQALPSNR